VPGPADDLARIPLFADLSKRQLRKLAGAFQEQRFGPGTTIVREGHNSGVGFFVIAEGTAAVTVSGKTVAHIGPGEHFGELAMITKQARGATVTAETPLRCLTIRFWDFRQFAMENGDVAWKLLEHVGGLLADERARRGAPAVETG
jgi:CRP-like cAMP-binding protein